AVVLERERLNLEIAMPGGAQILDRDHGCLGRSNRRWWKQAYILHIWCCCAGQLGKELPACVLLDVLEGDLKTGQQRGQRHRGVRKHECCEVQIRRGCGGIIVLAVVGRREQYDLEEM